jgi:hypothetical protein
MFDPPPHQQLFLPGYHDGHHDMLPRSLTIRTQLMLGTKSSESIHLNEASRPGCGSGKNADVSEPPGPGYQRVRGHAAIEVI